MEGLNRLLSRTVYYHRRHVSRRHSSATLQEILLIAHPQLHDAMRTALSLPRSPSTLPVPNIVRRVQTPQHRSPSSPHLELSNDVPSPLAPQLVFALIPTQDISILSKVTQFLNAISRWPPQPPFSPSSQAPTSSPSSAIQRDRDNATHLSNIPHIPHHGRHGDHVDKRDQSRARRPAEVLPPVGRHVWSRVSARSLSISYHLISILSKRLDGSADQVGRVIGAEGGEGRRVLLYLTSAGSMARAVGVIVSGAVGVDGRMRGRLQLLWPAMLMVVWRVSWWRSGGVEGGDKGMLGGEVRR